MTASLESISSRAGKKKDLIISIYIVLLGILSILYANSQSTIVVPATLILSLIAVVMVGLEYSVPIIISAYQFTYWVPYIYVTLLLLVIYIFKNAKKIPFARPTKWYLVVTALSMISLTLPGASLDYFLRNVISQLAVVFLFSLESDEQNDMAAIKAFCWSFFVKAGVMFYIANKYGSLDYIIRYRFGYATMIRFIPEWLEVQNENSFATMATLTISFLYILVNKDRESGSQSLICVIGIVAAAILGLLTKSRTFILTIALFALLILMFRKAPINKKLTSIIVYLVVIIGGYFAIKKFMPVVLEGVIGRFMYEDLSNGRNDIFSTINERFFSSGLKEVLFGYLAVKNYGTALGITKAFHNVFQRAYVLHGLIGFTAIVGLIISSYQYNRQYTKKEIDFMYFMPLVITFAAGLGSNPDLIIFIFCLYILRIDREGTSVPSLERELENND